MKESQLILSCEDIQVSYDGGVVLDKLTCQLPAQKRIAILGPNGAGKSTFIKAILGIVPFRGRVTFAVKPSEIVYTAQRQEVDWDFPVTAIDVALMGLYREIGWFKPIQKKHKQAAIEALNSVGMADLADKSLSDLSVGQQQRVFLARALINKQAKLFLFDEPFAGVDMRTASIIHNIFASLAQEGKSILCVHHELNSVAEHFDYGMLILEDGIALGTPSEVLSVENLAKAYGVPLQLRA